MKKLERVLGEDDRMVELAVRELWKVMLPVLRKFDVLQSQKDLDAVAAGVADKIKELAAHSRAL